MAVNIANVITQARQAGISDDVTLSHLQQQGLIPSTGQPGQAQAQPQGNNMLQNMVDDPLKTLLVQPAVRAYQAGQALYGTLTGNDHLAGAGERDVNLNVPLLGNINVPSQKSGVQGIKQISGDTLKTAAYLAPGLGEGTVGAQVVKNSIAGSAFGTGQALQDNAPGSQVLQQGLEGGVFGGVVGGVTAGGSKILNAVTQQLPEKLYNSALKPTLDELQKTMKFDDFKTLNQQLIERGISGSPEKLLQLAQDGLKTNEDALQTMLKGSSATVSRDSLSQYLEPLVSKLADTPGMQDEFNQVHGVLSQFPKEVPIEEANVIKRNLYAQLNNLAYKLDANLSTKREAMKALASGIKTEIEKATGDIAVPMGGNIGFVDGGLAMKNRSVAMMNPVQAVNQNLALFGKLQDRTLKVLAQEARKSGISLTDLITIGSSVASGHGMAGLGLDMAKHAVTTPNVLTKAAVGLSKLKGKGLPKVLTTGLKKAVLSGAAQGMSTK